MMPTMQKIFFERFKDLRSQWENDSGHAQWKNVEMSQVLHRCFDDAVNILIFGETSPDKVPQIFGKPFSEAVEEFAK